MNNFTEQDRIEQFSKLMKKLCTGRIQAMAD